MLKFLDITNFKTRSNHKQDIKLSYELFGQPIHKAPIVLVNHALTGNSNVAGPDGWWSTIIGEGKCIDTRVYTVLVFNIPGNGYDGFVIENYKDFVAGDMASIFLEGLKQLKIFELFAIIGGSLGGGIAWEMLALNPSITQHLIPIATDFKATDWLIANCLLQEQILTNSTKPIQDARIHAMLCYRTPASFTKRFKRSVNEELQVFNVESWLLHHGKKLQERFQLSAYKLMNQLLKTIDITRNGKTLFEALKNSNATIYIIAVDSDLFFIANENKKTYQELLSYEIKASYDEIKSSHGHDAFLMENQQLEALLKSIFKVSKKKKELEESR